MTRMSDEVALRYVIPLIFLLSGAGLLIGALVLLVRTRMFLARAAETVGQVVAQAGADTHVRGSGAPGFHGKTAYELASERQMSELCEEIAAQRAKRQHEVRT
ncbi:MAG: hypothetical protein ACRETT_01895 [Steroidobacteraceae bacterium]